MIPSEVLEGTNFIDTLESIAKLFWKNKFKEI